MLNSNQVKEMLIDIADMYIEKKEELSKYDAVIGDGDHGITMARGAKAAKEKLINTEEGTCRDYFKLYGRTLVSTIGGAMGPLFGSIFLELSKACKGNETFGINELSIGISEAEKKVCDLGGAKVGDKTMVDALHPTAEALMEAKKNEDDLQKALKKAVEAAKLGVQSTIPLVAKRGRSKYLQEKAIGHQDAGATSIYYLIKEIDRYLGNKGSDKSEI
ncbi:dihydroxyacetone kinase subunit DhaL [Maledivibacter halophilus]|uniref:phosphoenolpyruvate--glycerone phosphotransferase n=1 Tax=Maledivibacter halophilus TaxID=36842 RepID=A0A1T5MN81_9FIRM|nr:dihydroxyacetone kinase subunit DhaL [Maledivibacter halophilus]SKC89666.1 dihydroxyacetone kinase DhaL subunit [Maledivibacter halophilus]